MSREIGSLCISVDCGSTNLKAAVYTSDLELLSSAAVPVIYSLHDGIHVELDPENIGSAFQTVLGQAIESAGIHVEEIGCVSFGSQAQTFCLCDRDGNAVSPFYSWMDRSAESEAREILEILGSEFHRHCSFSSPIPQLQFCKMLRVQRMTGLSGEEYFWASLPGFLAMRLGLGNWIDSNLAAMSGLYSLVEDGWWTEALNLLGITETQCPGIVDIHDVRTLPKTCPHTGLRQGSRIVLAGNDQTVGAIGNDCVNTGMVVTLGTALVIYRYAGSSPGPFSSGGCWGPYPYGGYYELGTFDEGCSSLNWAIAEILDKEDPKAFDCLAQQGREMVGQCDRDMCRFYPSKMGTPDAWNTQQPADKPELAYAVLEGIAFSLRRLIEVNLGVREIPKKISVIGGGSNSPIWLQIIADVLNCEVSQGKGDSLLGAAMLATGNHSRVSGGISGTVIFPDAQSIQIVSERYSRWSTENP